MYKYPKRVGINSSRKKKKKVFTTVISLWKKSVPKYLTEVSKLNHNDITNCDHGKYIYHSEYFSDLSLRTSQSRKTNEISCSIHTAYHAKMSVFLSLANSLSSDSYFHVFKQGK